MSIIDEYVDMKRQLKQSVYTAITSNILKTLKKHDFPSIEGYLLLEAIILNPNCSQREIAKITGSKQTATFAKIQVLEKKGYITNTDDPNDVSKRLLKRKLVNPTPKGVEVYNKIKEELDT